MVSINKLQSYKFLFTELVKRDFKQKYKRTVLGMVWSILSPLLTLLILKLVFTGFFGRSTPHYTIYMFCGTLVMSYYKESTKGGMISLMNNSAIISKINVPKYLFLLSKNVSSLINFLLTLCLFVLFCIFDHIHFGTHMLMVIFPIACLLIMNIGIGMILSAGYVFFRDMQYLYDVFLTLLTYLSAIFYTVDNFRPTVQRLFMCNPVYVFIKYFRMLFIESTIPSLGYHCLCLFYAFVFLGLGCLIYKKYNHEFIYYL